jgi:hypothetical protein
MDQPVPSAPALSAPPISILATTNPAPAAFSVPIVNSSVRSVGPVGFESGNGTALRGTGGGLGGVPGGKPGGLFGEKDTKGLGLAGTFYDTKQTRNRKDPQGGENDIHKLVSEFVKEGFKESVFNNCFKAPGTLWATQIVVPTIDADEGPKAFEMEKLVKPSRWLVHYKGKVSPAQDGVYHFVGGGDDYMVVRFNGKLVLDHGWQHATDWKGEKYYNYEAASIPKGFARGDKMELKAGQWYEMEVLIGEEPGGKASFCLLLEQEGIDYRKDKKGNPILPVFRLSANAVLPEGNGDTLPVYDPVGPIWTVQKR